MSIISLSQLRRKLLIPTLAIAIPVCITLTASEIALRVLGFRSSVIHAEMFDVNLDDPLLPFTLHAGYEGLYAGGVVTVGADGNRIVPAPLDADKTEFLHKIVLLGDSVVFGQGVDDAGTIPANVQRLLYDRGSRSRVVSIAAPGYTSWNEYAAFSKYPDLPKVQTLIVVYVNHTERGRDNDHFKFRETGGRIHYMEQNILHKILRMMYDNSRLFFLTADSVKRVWNAVRQPSPEWADGLDAEALSYSVQAVENLQELCEKRNIKLVVAIYRDSAIYRYPDWVLKYEDAVSSALTSKGVDHFVLRWATDRLSQNRFAISWNDGVHPSAEASRIIAEEIAAELARRGS